MRSRIEDLAADVLATLGLQRKFFAMSKEDSGARTAALRASKEAEARLRKTCEDILRGPTLFGDDQGTTR